MCRIVIQDQLVDINLGGPSSDTFLHQLRRKSVCPMKGDLDLPVEVVADFLKSGNVRSSFPVRRSNLPVKVEIRSLRTVLAMDVANRWG